MSTRPRSWIGRLALAGLLTLAVGCQDSNGQDRRGPVTTVSTPTTQPAAAASASAATSQPDLTEELTVLRRDWLAKLGAGYDTCIESPFLVVCDGGAGSARTWMSRTVQSAAVRIQRQYMKVYPDKPMVVLLFVNQDTYKAACRKVLQTPDPPYYGFYQPWRRTLVMDISTGGGTLVHEMTHALIDFDFPEIPNWFNEGLGSLYEQSQFTGDGIRGLVNWRLPGLQKALAAERLDPIAKLPGKSFRTGDVGLNYAQARYLCFYMQEKGLLGRFYTAFRDRRAEDPTGLKFLREVFAPQSLDDVDRDFRRWVKTLRWPPGR
ncbi:MAG: hypothetical protein BIFFINMI_04123 [Phycisphaerae bacterium]|nr:hypothetical protein [Phycisphaerae bacterium]